MSFTTKGLREERAKLFEQSKALLQKAHDEKRDMTAEERSQFTKLNTDIDAYKVRIDDAEKLNALESEMSEADYRAKEIKKQEVATVPNDNEDRAAAFRAWAKVGSNYSPTADEREAAKRCGFNLRENKLSLRVGETRALSVSTGSAGAYTVPQGFITTLEKALLQFNGVRKVAQVLRTTSGEQMPYPTVNDTGNVGAILTEGSAAADDVDPTFGQIIFNSYVFTSKILRVPATLLTDNAVNLEARLGELLGERIGRSQSAYFTTGTGTSQPKGIVTAAASGATAAAANAVAYADLVNLQASVDAAYDSECSWMAHQATIAQIKGLVDSQGRPLWTVGIAPGTPDTILGKPFTINNDMSKTSSGTTQKFLLYGALGKYMIRDVAEIVIQRLNERYAEYNQVGFVAWLRSDGNLLDAGTHPVKYLVEP